MYEDADISGEYLKSVDAIYSIQADVPSRATPMPSPSPISTPIKKIESTPIPTNLPAPTPSPVVATAHISKATSIPPQKEYTPSELSNYRFLQLGSSGADVKKLQNRLIELGYMSGSSSGSYDEYTQAAVEAFQKRNGEWVDGVAGEDTQTKLYSNSALYAPND